MRSKDPVLLALPAFRGLTRKLILFSIGSFLFFFVLSLVAPGVGATLVGLLVMHPDEAPKLIWQLIAWPFIPDGLLGLLFALLSLWYFGSSLEEERGTRWFSELFFVTTICGAILTCIVSLSVGRYVAIINAPGKYSNGLWPVVLGLIVAYARLHPEESMTFNFVIRARAKYMAAIFVVGYVAIDYFAIRRIDALNAICNCIVAFLFVQIVGRRGLRHSFSEGWFGIRNSYYRGRRRRAAKKFQVYMRKQGKDVSIDESGKYVGFDDDDPSDRRRMN